jgi:hypothetical protein
MLHDVLLYGCCNSHYLSVNLCVSTCEDTQKTEILEIPQPMDAEKIYKKGNFAHKIFNP